MAQGKQACRGRIQAQGDNTEKSAPWAQKDPPPKQQGLNLVDALKGKLTARELNARRRGFVKAIDFICEAAANGGVCAPTKKSFPEIQGKPVRVDIEVQAGMAFVADPA